MCLNLALQRKLLRPRSLQMVVHCAYLQSLSVFTLSQASHPLSHVKCFMTLNVKDMSDDMQSE